MSLNLKGWNVGKFYINLSNFDFSTFQPSNFYATFGTMLKKGDPKIIRAWTFYDWANSVYPLVISSAIFPIFYEIVTQKKLGGKISIFGGEFINTEFYSYLSLIHI